MSTQCELINQKYLWLEVLRFNGQGLIPAIIQDVEDASVLMLIEMDKNLLRKVIDSEKLMSKYSVRSIFCDCDADALLLEVEQDHYEKPNWSKI